MLKRLLCILVLFLLTASCSLPKNLPDKPIETPSPSASASPTSTEDVSLYIEEIVEGIRVMFSASATERDIRKTKKSIRESLNILPEYMVSEIRTITIYVVRNAIKCPTTVGVSRVAGCANHYEKWIELIQGQPTSVVLHEFGHIIGGITTPRGTNIYSIFFAEVYSKEPISPTEYGRRNILEDFAESFTIYFLAPKILKNGYPMRYEFFKKLEENSL